MLKWYLEQKLWIQIVLPIVCIGTFIVIIFLVIPRYNGPEENCVFINEKVNLHEEYYITVEDISLENDILYLKNQEDTEKSELIGTDKHYVGVKIKIEHQALANPKENHPFDLDDFKLKDHTGVQLKNINFFSKEDGLALETTDFTTRQPIKDYIWYGKSVESGEVTNIELYYEFSKKMSAHNTLMVLETDFFSGRSNGKSGTDIVLAYRKS